MEQSAAAVQATIDSGRVAYGINTGSARSRTA